MTLMRSQLLLAAAAAALIAGCSQASDTSDSTDWPEVEQASTTADEPPADLPRPCTLVTADEAQVVVGSEVGQMADDADVCMWAGGDHPTQITMLMVQLFRADTVDETATLFENLAGLSGNLGMMVNESLEKPTRKSGQDIEDLGDAAWCSASNADLIGTHQLIVRRGRVLLSLNITGLTKDGRQASRCPQLEAAGRQAFARLGAAS